MYITYKKITQLFRTLHKSTRSVLVLYNIHFLHSSSTACSTKTMSLPRSGLIEEAQLTVALSLLDLIYSKNASATTKDLQRSIYEGYHGSVADDISVAHKNTFFLGRNEFAPLFEVVAFSNNDPANETSATGNQLLVKELYTRRNDLTVKMGVVITSLRLLSMPPALQVLLGLLLEATSPMLTTI